ncbi:Protein of unknown function DUF3435, partial [Penicillium cf. griseofulvum]
KNLYLRVNKASKRAKDPSTIKDTLAISRPSSPPTARSKLKYSRARTILSSKPPPDTTSSLYGGYPFIEIYVYVGREYATRTAKGKRVYYSTKLRYKAGSRSRRPKKR